MIDDSFDDATNLHIRLEQLRVEHRDLDDAIARLTANQLDDELLIRRLKKRKLALKDRITVIERMLEPDERA
ncbi:MAG TPA: YdcH family protein [Rhodocyclaceae bacterium]|nr:YdcH family protein [Rhodocyclaceae bacterium]